MSEVYEEFITLTPLNCLQKVNALLGSDPPKTRGCGLFLTLFGVYCGVLMYRTYRNYCRTRDAKENKVPFQAKIEAINSVPTPSLMSEHASSQTPIHMQPVGGSSRTDIRWRYGDPQKASTAFRASSADDEDVPQRRHVTEKDAPTPSTVSIATSTTTSRPTTAPHGSRIDGDSTNSTPFKT